MQTGQEIVVGALSTQEINIPCETDLVHAGIIADHYVVQGCFQVYQETISANTQRRQLCELDAFSSYLAEVGVQRSAHQLFTDVFTWQGMTAGLLQGFLRWQISKGIAIGTINLRLATLKRYSALAMQARVISTENYALLAQVKGYSHKAGRNLDRQRETSRVGKKKAETTVIGQAHVQLLKQQPLTSSIGRRDALLMCLLLDLGLRCGEVAALQTKDLNLEQATLTFYREKVDLEQTHNLTPDAFCAAQAYLPDIRGETMLFPGYTNLDGGTHSLTPRAIFARVRLLGQRIGIEHLSPHDCRHYWATQAMKSGTSVDRLQEAGGWKSPAMPLRYATRARIANEGVKLK